MMSIATVAKNKVMIKVDKFINYRTDEIVVAKQGLAYLEEWLNSDDCKESIVNTKFTSTNKSSLQIYNRLISGSDDMNEATDCTINLSFTMYYSWWSRVIGWVTHGKRMINTNRKYFYYPVDFAANAIHEYMHMTGFDHRNASDSGSVPYKVGTLFQVWAYKKYGNERN